jgi:uncharacterized protein
MNAPMNATMNARSPDPKADQKLMLVDCDIHPIQKPGAVAQYLSAQWRDHMATYGAHIRQGLQERIQWPRMMASGQRADAYPPDGGPPGSSYEMLRDQHLDPHGIEHGMLIALSKGGMEERNQDYAAALMHACNQWQKEHWVDRDPRLHAGIVVNGDDVAAAVKEIELRAQDKAFVQIILSPRTNEPLGRRRFWPIFAIAQETGLPLGLHPAAHSGGAPSTGAGWPTYYMQEHYTFSTASEAVATSLVMEGVFEEFPRLKIAMIESGLSWAPILGWRMDRIWERMRSEVPRLKRPPSEYLRQYFWFATQPIEEPENPQHLLDVFDWLGWDRLIYSSDYPHWDYDDPRFVLRVKISDEQRLKLFRSNALALYNLDR